MGSLEVRTLRQFLESDQVIHCDCSNHWNCSHTGPLRIEMAIQRLGWDFDFYAGRDALASRVYCSVCGKRTPTFRLSWKTRPQTYTGTHGAGIATRSVLSATEVRSTWREPVDWLVGGGNVRKFGPRR